MQKNSAIGRKLQYSNAIS